MQMETVDVAKKVALKRVMQTLFDAFPNKARTDAVKASMLDQWYEDLRDLNMEAITNAAQAYRKTEGFFPKICDIRELAEKAGYKPESGNLGGSDYYRNYRAALECSLPFDENEYHKWNYSHTKNLSDGEIHAVNKVRRMFPRTREYLLTRMAHTLSGWVECGNEDEMHRMEATQSWGTPDLDRLPAPATRVNLRVSYAEGLEEPAF